MAGKQYFVYITTNHKNTVLYTGVTGGDLGRRIYAHKHKLVSGFTSKYNVWKLVYYEVHDEIASAIKREKQIKNLLRRKKEELINSMNPKFEELNLG